VVLGYKVIYYIPIDDGMGQVLGRGGGIPRPAVSFPARLCTGEELAGWSSDQAKYSLLVNKYKCTLPPATQQGGLQVLCGWPVWFCSCHHTQPRTFVPRIHVQQKSR